MARELVVEDEPAAPETDLAQPAIVLDPRVRVPARTQMPEAEDARGPGLIRPSPVQAPFRS